MSSAIRLSTLVITVAVAATSPVSALELPPIKSHAGNAVPACATADRLAAYLRTRNPVLDRRFEMVAAAYYHHGAASGIRWDYAFFQMIVETGGLTFRRPNGTPGAVRAEQNNFAGIGASGGGVSGETFADIDTGVVAHLQHVRLYAGDRIAVPVAERTRKVQAWGILSSWQQRLTRPITFADLAKHWAPSDHAYGQSILSVASRFYNGLCLEPAPALIAVHKPNASRGNAPAQAPTAASMAAASQRPEPTPGEILARAAAARSLTEDTVPRHGLGAAAIIEAPPVAPQKVALQNVKILNAAPPAPELKEAAMPAPIVASLAPPVAAMPSPAPMPEQNPDEALRALVTGRTVHLDTPLGSTIPISFQADGTTRGRSESLAGYLGSASDEGRWWVERQRLCQRWKIWFDKETQCLRFRHSGDVIHWTRDDGRKGTARIAKQ